MVRRGLALCLLLCLALAGCGVATTGSSSSGSGRATPAAAQPTSVATTTCVGGGGCGATEASGAMGVQVFVEPAAGEAPILHAIESAQTSVWVEVYLLTDNNVIHALEDAAQRGVEARVLLEPN